MLFSRPRWLFLGLLLALFASPIAWAQVNPVQGGQQAFAFPGGQQAGGQQTGGQQGAGGLGGGADADFDSLIDLIVSTVAPETWADAGGEADIRPFVSGVFVDAAGTLRRAATRPTDQLVALRRDTRRSAGEAEARPAAGVRQRSALRCVSLVRLEREIERRQKAGEPLDEAMLTLAGLRRAEYVFLFPATDDQPGDLVIAGPAGDWRAEQGRLLAHADGRSRGAVVRLDDLIELLRHTATGGASFGCTIDPRADALAKAQQYINQAAAKPLRPGLKQRERWLEEIRSRVGKQDIRFFDIDSSTHTAQVLIEADHHMKLIGMGLADGVLGVDSYLDSIDIRPGEAPPAFGVLRWWFAMNYAEVRGTDDRDAFQLVGPGAKVLSENELLTEKGERVATGQSNELTARFAATFTANFDAMCAKHPVYSELRNAFDLSLIATLIRDERLAERAGWTPTLFTDSGLLPLPKHRVPKTVETVANHRLINRKHIVAGVSGGVDADADRVLRTKSRPAGDTYGPLTEHTGEPPKNLAQDAWWWDAN